MNAPTQGPSHRVGKIGVEIGVADLPSAMRVRARAEELAWRHLPAVLEKVFAALAPPQRHVRIARLQLDLGEIDEHALERDLLPALETALRAALAEAIARAGDSPGPAASSGPPGAALLDDFDAYLCKGHLAQRAAALAFDPAAILRRLLDERPAELLTLLARRSGVPHAIERLVLQVREDGLRALLARLAPADAAGILGYLATFERLQPAALPSQLPGAALRRRLWILSLEYLLHEAGTQFNRRSYLAALVAGLARAEALSYGALLSLLRAAAHQTRKRQPLDGALLSTLDQLLGEQSEYEAAPRAGVAAPAPLAAAEASATLELAEAGEPGALLALLERTLTQPQDMAALVHAMTAAAFAAVIARLQAQHARLILAYLDELSAIQASHRPLPGLGEADLRDRLRLLALRYLLLEAGSQFNRLSWLRRLLHGLAMEAGTSYRALLDALGVVLDGLHARLPLAGSLLEAVAALRREGAETPLATRNAHGDAPAASVASEAALTMAERFLRSEQPAQFGAGLADLAAARPAAFGALLRRLVNAASGAPGPLLGRLLAWMPAEAVAALVWPGQAELAARWADALAEQPGASQPEAWTRLLEAGLRGAAWPAQEAPAGPGPALDRIAVLRHWLVHDALPWWAPAGLTLDDALSSLARLPVAALLGLFDELADVAAIAQCLARIHARLAPAAAEALMERLAPTPHAPHEIGGLHAAAALLAGLSGVSAGVTAAAPPAPVPARDAAAAAGSAADALWPAALIWLAGEPNGAGPPTAAHWRLLAGRLEDADAALDAALRAGLARPSVRQLWAVHMPPEVLARLLHRLAPARARGMLELHAVLHAAWRRSAPASARHGSGVRLWSLLLAGLAEQPLPEPHQLARQLVAGLAADHPHSAAPTLAQALHLAMQGGYVNARAALMARSLAATPPGLAQASGAASAPGPRSTRAAARPDKPAAFNDGDVIYIANAGLVLLHPFLPHLLRQSGMLGEDAQGRPRVLGTEHATRAVQLLQYLTDGRGDAPEAALALNKLLCGLDLEQAIGPATALSEAERDLCEQLLRAVIGQWSAIGNSSSAALRETFLQRDGRLLLRDGKWSLTVSRKTVDVLVDQIPWGFAIVLQPWMPHQLSVTW